MTRIRMGTSYPLFARHELPKLRSDGLREPLARHRAAGQHERRRAPAFQRCLLGKVIQRAHARPDLVTHLVDTLGGRIQLNRNAKGLTVDRGHSPRHRKLTDRLGEMGAPRAGLEPVRRYRLDQGARRQRKPGGAAARLAERLVFRSPDACAFRVHDDVLTGIQQHRCDIDGGRILMASSHRKHATAAKVGAKHGGVDQLLLAHPSGHPSVTKRLDPSVEPGRVIGAHERGTLCRHILRTVIPQAPAAAQPPGDHRARRVIREPRLERRPLLHGPAMCTLRQQPGIQAARGRVLAHVRYNIFTGLRQAHMRIVPRGGARHGICGSFRPPIARAPTSRGVIATATTRTLGKDPVKLNIRIASSCAALLVALATPLAAHAAPAPCSGCWLPAVDATFQYQLSDNPIDRSVDADVYDVDGVETRAATVTKLHDAGRHVVCYFSAGSWENWRADRGRFPKRVIGRKLDGWAGERWLDIRRIGVLGPIMKDRMRACKRKGFDAVDPDNVNAWEQPRTGFHISRRAQIRYNRWLADTAHKLGLSVALKNDGGQVAAGKGELVAWFDFAVTEECFQFNECALYSPFIAAGKPVFDTEYTLETSDFCDDAATLNMFAMKKRLKLDAWREACPAP